MTTNKPDHNLTGKLGENLACKYLTTNGYKIVGQNFRRPFGEIDIIAVDKSGILIFAEVKTIRQCQPNITEKPSNLLIEKSYPHNIQFTAEDHLTASKLHKLKKICSYYVGLNPELIDEEKGWQIDLLALTINDNRVSITHYKNISSF